MKKLVLIVTVAVVSLMAKADTTYDGDMWTYQFQAITSTADIGGGNDPATGALSWTAVLYAGSDDSVLGTTTIIGYQGTGTGYYIQGFGSLVTEGKTVYMTAYNAATVGEATYALTSDSLDLQDLNAPWSSPAENVDLDFGSSSWQAVPEPATAMLLALGGGLAWLVRMKQRMI